ncbi:MAG: hypothetical protein KDI51_17335, partial [Xanthomonadales bacterium]|nr:hypothetical protein [Xanthomonadales bacterium]
VPLESTQAQLLSQPGAAGVAVRDGSDLRVYWTDGQLPDSLTLPYLFEPVTLLPQGLFHGLQWFPRDGGDPVPLDDDPFRSGFGMQVAAGERIHLVSQTDFGTIKLWGLDTVTSALIWTTELRGNSSLVWAYPAANDDQVLLIGSNAADLDLRWVNRGDGSLISTRSVECGAPQCRFELSGQPSGPAGLDLLELRIQDDTTSALRAVHQSTVPAATRADQAGVAGLWFHPGLAGQGLVLSYVPESRTLFAPWFNYVPYGRTHDQSTLRWYSLQGNAELAANAVELQLLRNAGGRFGEPPATQAEVVGSARIQFESCDRATLHYDFGDAEEGAGSQPLIRLGPSNRSCVLADGTVQAPALVAADREGFSSRQSGAWFDPLSAGQGLMFEVVPASTSQAGLLFAAWFSYDREGEGDDEFAHDWFILQGDLSQASSGRLVVPIYRSIGGAFDRRQTSNLFRVGEAELQFDDCNSLQLSYRFDDSELAQSHAGLQGQQSLQRIGGCTAAGAN